MLKPNIVPHFKHKRGRREGGDRKVARFSGMGLTKKAMLSSGTRML